jgi:hypothetical protein
MEETNMTTVLHDKLEHKFTYIDSTHCKFGWNEFKDEVHPVYHIAQLNDDVIKVLDNAGLLSEDKRFFKPT